MCAASSYRPRVGSKKRAGDLVTLLLIVYPFSDTDRTRDAAPRADDRWHIVIAGDHEMLHYVYAFSDTRIPLRLRLAPYPSKLSQGKHSSHGPTIQAEGMREHGPRSDGQMASGGTEQRALQLLKALETAGKTVSSIVIEGRRIEVVLSSGQAIDEFERIDMRHGKT